MAKTIRVMPLPDDVSLRSNWQVKVSGGRVSKHTHKTAARRRARREANDGDQMIIQRVDGTIQENKTVRKG